MSVVGSAKRLSSVLSVDDEGYKTYTSTWQVQTDARTDGPLTVITAGSLPSVGSSYAWLDGSDTACVRTPYLELNYKDLRGTSKLWTATIKHTNKLKDCKTATPDNPLAMPMRLSGSWVKKMKIATEDSAGDAILNSSDEPIFPGLEARDDRDTVVIEINTATLSLAFRDSLKNTVNSNAMWGLAARCIALDQWDWSLGYYGACLVYFANRLTFAINADGWDPEVLDQGFHRKAGVVDGKQTYELFASTKDRGPLRTPVLLDGAGDKKDDADPPVYLPPFEIDSEADYSALGLPDPLW